MMPDQQTILQEIEKNLTTVIDNLLQGHMDGLRGIDEARVAVVKAKNAINAIFVHNQDSRPPQT